MYTFINIVSYQLLFQNIWFYFYNNYFRCFEYFFICLRYVFISSLHTMEEKRNYMKPYYRKGFQNSTRNKKIKVPFLLERPRDLVNAGTEPGRRNLHSILLMIGPHPTDMHFQSRTLLSTNMTIMFSYTFNRKTPFQIK